MKRYSTLSLFCSLASTLWAILTENGYSFMHTMKSEHICKPGQLPLPPLGGGEVDVRDSDLRLGGTLYYVKRIPWGKFGGMPQLARGIGAPACRSKNLGRSWNSPTENPRGKAHHSKWGFFNNFLFISSSFISFKHFLHNAIRDTRHKGQPRRKGQRFPNIWRIGGLSTPSKK